MNSLDRPAWRVALEAAIGLEGNNPTARYAQLATVRPDGRPAARTLVFRGFLDGSDALTFTADARSRKLAETGRVELCWYLAASREQFRIAGTLRAVGPGDPDCDSAWAGLSDGSRRTFAWPEPGAPRAEPSAFEVEIPDASRPPSNFRLLVLDPDGVDHLELRGDPHRRRIARLGPGGGWSVEEVNP